MNRGLYARIFYFIFWLLQLKLCAHDALLSHLVAVDAEPGVVCVWCYLSQVAYIMVKCPLALQYFNKEIARSDLGG